jgi:hypothetical protein
MRAQSWLALTTAIALIIGCSDGGTAGQAPGPERASAWEPRSGTRLLARYLVGDDGSRVWHGWFDSARKEPCRIARGESGRYSCFPEGNRAVFRDDRCREPAAEHRACAHRYTAVARGDSRCGNETMSLWEEGEALPAGDAFRLVNDFCSGPVQPVTGRVFALTRRVADTDLVRGTAESGRPDLRIGPRLVRFEDGAVAPLDMLDGGRSRRCVRVDTAKGTRCLPESVLYIGRSGPYFSDQACSVPVAHADAPACLMPTLALKVEGASGCYRVTEAYRLQANRRLDPRFVWSGASCETNRILPGHFYELSEPVDLASFPELKVQESVAGRIRISSFVGGDGVAIPPLGQHLYDSQLQMECRVATAQDGKLRCLPLDGPELTLDDPASAVFADAACARPLARYSGDRACRGPAPPAPMVARVAQRQCLDPTAMGSGSPDDPQPGRWQIFQLGARHEGQVYFQRAAGCQAGAAPAEEQLYELGEALPPETFVGFREG